MINIELLVKPSTSFSYFEAVKFSVWVWHISINWKKFGKPAVADTGWFGGGDAMSICNEPNASQHHAV